MDIVEKFNGLNGCVVSRNEIVDLLNRAKAEGQLEVENRLQRVLANHEDKKLRFEINHPATECLPESLLCAIDYEQDNDEMGALGKAVSQKEIYDMITGRLLEMMKEGHKYKKSWKGKIYGTGYTIPFNFVSKKRYRGVNFFMLSGLFEPLENPFYMTFKQVSDLGGTVKKGSVGFPIVYYTNLYKAGEMASYDLEAVRNHAKENGLSEREITSLPILKYYKVFNGKQIDGINFDLDNFKIGKLEGELPKGEKLEIPEAIWDAQPKPAPKLGHGGDRAYYRPAGDSIQMPHIVDFDTVQDYYRTLFHELGHATGSYKRLDRDFSGKFGDKKYAFEELIAEFAATFISAEAGIIWHANGNHAAYLANWNAALTHAKDDNKFLFKAATAAQKAADFILQFDADGNPKYLSELKNKIEVPKPLKKYGKKRPFTPKVRETFTPGWYHRVFAIKRTGAPAEIHEMIPTEAEAQKIFDKLVSNPENEIIDWEKRHYVTKHKIDNVKPVKLKTNKPSEPEPYAVKPKSVSVATAIADVLSLPKFSGMKPRQATTIYKYFKDYEPESIQDGQYVWVSSEYDQAMLKKDSDMHSLFVDELTLTGLGVEFVQSVSNRLDSLRKQKYNYSLFPLNGPGRREVQGLSGAENIIVDPQPQSEPTRPAIKGVQKIGTANSSSLNFYDVRGEIGKFLQRVERKPVESVVITIDGEQGAGKTTMLYKFMDAFASGGNNCVFLSAEEHPTSSLAIDKADKFLSADARNRIDAIGEVENTDELYKLIAAYDVIFIDSWQKLQRMVGGIRLDEDLRKKFNGKVFVIIFQQTTTGRTKGGAEVVFDGDIIIKMKKEARFADNYAWFDKNRYTLVPIETLRYNIARGEVYNPEATNDQQTAPVLFDFEPVIIN